jgi:predicted transcriptional regulator of viral defense system
VVIDLARPNRYQIMDLYREDILSQLNEINSTVLSMSQIESILAENRHNWRLPNSTTLQQFLDYLIIQKKILKMIEFGTESRKEKRFLYTKKDIDNISLALSLYPNSYLSHYSAVMFHDLTDEIIKSTYVNHEQSKKNNSKNKVIPQKNIDFAFTKPMRSTNNYLDYNNQRIYIVNSQYSNNLGVIERGNIRVTDIERTLIDITVRPQYSGGVFEVLNIFKKAKGEASVNRIAAYLKKLDYIYPYHQAIGFYLEKAGYKEHTLNLIEKKFSFENDFYLTYNIENKEYNNRWKIYFPKNI